MKKKFKIYKKKLYNNKYKINKLWFLTFVKEDVHEYMWSLLREEKLYHHEILVF